MRLIIDTNRIFSALISNGLTRKIIIDSDIEFYSPEFGIEEIDKYKSLILQKSGLKENEFNILISTILEKIIVVPKEKYLKYMKKAENIIGKADINDVPFIALALAIENDGIWSEDNHFQQQNEIKIWKNNEIIS